MSYKPRYKITPKIIDLVSKISEAVGKGDTLTLDQITAILDGKSVIVPINGKNIFFMKKMF